MTHCVLSTVAKEGDHLRLGLDMARLDSCRNHAFGRAICFCVFLAISPPKWLRKEVLTSMVSIRQSEVNVLD